MSGRTQRIGSIAVVLLLLVTGAAVGCGESDEEKAQNDVCDARDDILYVEKWPWKHVDDWWNYRNRRRMDVHYAAQLQRIIGRSDENNAIGSRSDRLRRGTRGILRVHLRVMHDERRRLRGRSALAANRGQKERRGSYRREESRGHLVERS